MKKRRAVVPAQQQAQRKRKKKKKKKKPVVLDWANMFPQAGIIGQTEAMGKLQTFMSWFEPDVLEVEHPKHVLALLYGRPGTGKTRAVHCVAEKRGFRVLEINASDTRSYNTLLALLRRAGIGKTLGRKRQLILLDGIDGALETSIAAITDFLQQTANFRTRVPILCTSSQPAGAKCHKPLLPYAWMVPFHRLFQDDMRRLLSGILKTHGLHISTATRADIKAAAEGDVRQLANLVFLHHHRPLSSKPNCKDLAGTTFDAVRLLLKGEDLDELPHTDQAAAIIENNVFDFATSMHAAATFASWMSAFDLLPAELSERVLYHAVRCMGRPPLLNARLAEAAPGFTSGFNNTNKWRDTEQRFLLGEKKFLSVK